MIPDCKIVTHVADADAGPCGYVSDREVGLRLDEHVDFDVNGDRKESREQGSECRKPRPPWSQQLRSSRRDLVLVWHFPQCGAIKPHFSRCSLYEKINLIKRFDLHKSWSRRASTFGTPQDSEHVIIRGLIITVGLALPGMVIVPIGARMAKEKFLMTVSVGASL
jgi:hypothetical protein